MVFIGSGFLARWLMPRACQCTKGIWIMPLEAKAVSAEVTGKWEKWGKGKSREFKKFLVKLRVVHTL